MSDDRNPFRALNDHIRAQARSQIHPSLLVGQVLSLRPPVVRADGLDLTGEDLYCCRQLLPDWDETLTGLQWPLTADIPEKKFVGFALVDGSRCYAEVTRPEEVVRGRTCETARITHGRALDAGDLVLMQRSPDGQSYYILDKVVSLDGYSFPADPVPENGSGGQEPAPAP